MILLYFSIKYQIKKDYGKLSESKISINPHLVKIGEIIEPCIRLIKFNAEKKNLTITTKYNPNRIINVDERRLKQVLINLLSNAVKFTTQGGILISVKEKAINENPMICISVKDTGMGIKNEDLNKLFKEFATLPIHQSMNPSGTGLGLYLSKNLIKLMDGDITVKTEFEKGSKFTIQLPCSRVDEYKETEIKSCDMTPIRTNGEFTPLKTSKKILIVDDCEMNSYVLASMVHKLGIDTIQEYNGKDAVNQVLNNSKGIGLIFMDINMPIMNGIEATQKLKDHMKSNKIGYIPIIAVTGDEKETIANNGIFDDICIF